MRASGNKQQENNLRKVFSISYNITVQLGATGAAIPALFPNDNHKRNVPAKVRSFLHV